MCSLCGKRSVPRVSVEGSIEQPSGCISSPQPPPAEFTTESITAGPREASLSVSLEKVKNSWPTRTSAGKET